MLPKASQMRGLRELFQTKGFSDRNRKKQQEPLRPLLLVLVDYFTTTLLVGDMSLEVTLMT